MTKRGLIFSLTGLLILWLAAAAGLAVAATKPDLKVTELTAARVQTQMVPLRIEVHIRIKNTGLGTGATQFITCLYYRTKSTDPWQFLYDWTSGAMAANGGAVYNRNFDFNEGGTYYFKAKVDDNNVVAESSESNNTKFLTKTFQAGTPDLTIVNLAASTISTTSSGATRVKVEWDVENIGDGKATGSFVTVLSVSKNTGPYNEVQRYTRYNLDKAQKVHFTYTGNFTNFNTLRFNVQTDATNKIHEKLEGNNHAFSNTIT